MANHYGIAGKAEAAAYLADDVLKNRHVEISTALLSLKVLTLQKFWVVLMI